MQIDFEIGLYLLCLRSSKNPSWLEKQEWKWTFYEIKKSDSGEMMEGFEGQGRDFGFILHELKSHQEDSCF